MISDFPSNGRFRILVFASQDLTSANGTSSRALTTICDNILPRFPQGTLELVILHPFIQRIFEWTDIPACVKEISEMRLHGPIDDKLYSTYGVDEGKGALVVVRPDGYVGTISLLADTARVEVYLRQCLVVTEEG